MKNNLNECKKCWRKFEKTSFPVSRVELANGHYINVCKQCTDIYNVQREKNNNGQNIQVFNSKYFRGAEE